jgi:hypothetical protein
MRLAELAGVDDSAQLVSLCAAFWAAVLGFARSSRSPGSAPRFVAGLVLGAALAHLGWVLQHLDDVPDVAAVIASPSGFSVLFFPLGPLLVMPRKAPARAREEFLAASFAPLPFALAVARVGCLAAGCCAGLELEGPRAGGLGRHPTPLYEIVGLLALQAGTHRLAFRFRAPAVLAGTALLRLLLEPLRATPPLGEPALPAGLLAAGWLAVAGALALRSSREAPS